MIEITDFDNLTKEQKQALVAVLTTNRHRNVFPVGTTGEVRLHHRIINHLSSGTERRGQRGPRIRYEVMDNKVFAKGTYGTYYRSLFTLSIDNEGNLQVKKRKPGTLRLIKEQSFAGYSSTRVSSIRREATIMQTSGFFHSKQLVQEGNSLFIVMREFPGIDLGQVMKSKTQLSIKNRFDLTLALLKALKEQIHDKGLVHRDIKPENILVNQNAGNFDIYIVDYGAIKERVFDDSQELVGTEPFSPLENCIPGIISNEKFDIYSMGIVLSYLWGISGVVADKFKNEYPAMTGRVEAHKQISEIILHMCCLNREQRPTLSTVIDSFKGLEDKFAVVKRRKTRSSAQEEEQEDQQGVKPK